MMMCNEKCIYILLICALQLVDLPTDAWLSHSDGSAAAPHDPTTYYQVVVDDIFLNNNNEPQLKVAQVAGRRPLSVIHEESLFNHFI